LSAAPHDKPRNARPYVTAAANDKKFNLLQGFRNNRILKRSVKI
jgi:hypothetical protein